MLLWSVALRYKRQPTHTILLFFSVNSSVAIFHSRRRWQGNKGKKQALAWKSEDLGPGWLQPPVFIQEDFFQRADSLPYTRWLQGTSRPICITNLLNKERYVLHQAKSEDDHRPFWSFERLRGKCYIMGHILTIVTYENELVISHYKAICNTLFITIRLLTDFSPNNLLIASYLVSKEVGLPQVAFLLKHFINMVLLKKLQFLIVTIKP